MKQRMRNPTPPLAFFAALLEDLLVFCKLFYLLPDWFIIILYFACRISIQCLGVALSDSRWNGNVGIFGLGASFRFLTGTCKLCPFLGELGWVLHRFFPQRSVSLVGPLPAPQNYQFQPEVNFDHLALFSGQEEARWPVLHTTKKLAFWCHDDLHFRSQKSKHSEGQTIQHNNEVPTPVLIVRGGS